MAKKTDDDNVLKLLLVGDTDCGKSLILFRYTHNAFSTYTTGVYFRTKPIDIDGNKILLEICDAAGQEEFHSVPHLYYRGAQGVMLVYDITNEKSFDHVSHWLRDVRQNTVDIEIILVGNNCKIDYKRQVSRMRGEQFAKEHGMHFMEISSTNGMNINDAFYTLAKGINAKYGSQAQELLSSKKTLREDNSNSHGIAMRVASTIKDFFMPKRNEEQNLVAAQRSDLIPDEIRQDPYTLQLYEKALRDGKETDQSIRINIVGNYRQGKTSLMRRLIGHEVEMVESTNGIEVEHYTCHRTPDGSLTYSKADDTDSDVIRRLVSVIHTTVDERNRFSITDTNPSESVLQTTSEQAQPMINIDELETGSHIEPEKALNADKSIGKDVDQILQSTAGKTNTCDETLNTERDDRRKVSLLSEEEKVRFAKEVKKAQATDSDLQASLDLWDFGGQYIFYATHTIFHSKRAIYLLVFDLSKPLSATVQDEDFTAFSSRQRNMEYFLRFWMNSIHSFVGSDDGTDPPVFLVGTHRDKLEGDANDQCAYIEHYFDEVRKMFDGTQLIHHIHQQDFSVDNTIGNDDVVVALREAIISVGNERSNAFEIPAKWIPLEKSLNAKRHLKIISFQFVSEIDAENEFPLGVAEQIKLFLQYHHAKGTYMYFDEKPLSEYVILDPKYLIDAFKSIITSGRFCRNKPEIRPFRQALETEARLDNQLIDIQWSEDESHMFMQHKDILLSFLIKHHIISEATTYDESSHKTEGLGWYVVPSMLKSEPEQENIFQFLQGKQQTALRFVMLFCDSSIVAVVYHRLLAATIGRWSIAVFVGVPLVFEHICIVRLNEDHAGITEMKNDTIELSVVNLCPTVCVDGEQADIFRRFSEAIISHEFRKLHGKDEMHTKPYSIQYRCNHETHGIDGSLSIMEIGSLHDHKNQVPCPDLVTHTINADKAKVEWYQDNRKALVIPDIPLDDKLLSRISQCIGNNWQLLGYELGLTQVQIEHITADHQYSTSLRIYYMLQIACRIMADSASMDSLVQSMQRCPKVTIEWDGIRNIVDDMVP